MASIHKNALPIPGWPIGRRTACPAAAPLATYTRSGRKRLAGRWNCVPTDEGGQVGWRGTPASLSPSPPPKNADESVTLQRRQSGRGAQNMDRYHIRSTAPKQMSPGPASAELGPQHQHRQLQPLRYPTSTTVAASPLPQQPHSARSAGVERRAPFARVPDSGSGGSSPLQAIADPHSELGCARFGLCSGCSLQDGLAAPPLYGEAKEFFQQLGLAEVPAVMYAARGWRCRAKLAVRGSAGRPLIGLFKEGSHDCVDIVDPAFQPPCGTGPAIVDTGRRRGGRSDGGFMAAAGSNSARDNNGGDNGGHLGWMGGDEAFSCRAHHPRINQAAVLIKELVTRLRIPPYNEPALAKARGGAAAAAANHQPPSARASRRQRRQRPLEGPGLPHPGGPNQETGPSATAEGILRYLQLTAVPSQPGNRAEEDPDAAVQVVLVLNLPAKCERNDPRVTSVLRLCRTLWHLAGPGGPMVPATDSPQPPLQSPSPSRSLSASSRYKAPVRAGDWAVWGAEDKRAPRPQKAVASLALSPRMGPDTPPLSNTPLVHSIWLNFQPDAQRNTVLGTVWKPGYRIARGDWRHRSVAGGSAAGGSAALC
ncbi:hypothetical protein Vretimale_16695 [Volvox reticuliferus]|uniref:Uncharacterized protein n=1 Tax=Volvox reticuliferus TaxID=1737510 RepID=A0A8J4GTI0_9CHLO|nr:hypothetical protein Vretimale_16695 [Volvox reticuliferus]